MRATKRIVAGGPKPVIELLITDLDNTLYDWVTSFTVSFYAMVEVAARRLDVPQETLLDELREVHREHHSSEQPFALLETGSVARRFPALDRAGRARELDEAFHAFNAARSRTLRLYDGVAEGLQEIRARGCCIVGHTEAPLANARFRLERLGVAALLSRLYAVEDHGPGHPNPTAAQPGDALPTRVLERHERKPNPDIVKDICGDAGVPPNRTLYVGDSVSRDIGMASQAGAWSAWARYGTRFDPSLWERLVRVTHWTEDDVRRAKEAESRFGGAQPDVVLETSFSELLARFEFHGPARAGRVG